MWMMVCWQIWWWKVWKCSRSVVSDSLWSYRLHIAAKLLSPWDFPGKNTGMDCHFLLQGIFRTQGSSGTEGRLFTIWAMREWKCWSLSSVQLLSRVRLFATPWTAARQASLSITNPQSSLKLMSIELVIPSSHLFFCCPLFLLPPIPPSIRVFSNEPTLRMRWSKYCSFRTQVCITVSQLDHLLFMITSAANVYAKGNLGWRREGNHYFMFSRTRKITLNSTLLRWLSFFISLKWLFERLSLE